MNLKILFMLLIYYGILSLTFLFGASTFLDNGYTTNIDFNETSDLASTEIDKGGFFNTGVDFGRFFIFVAFGIGLPDDTPSWFAIIFSLWQILFLIFTVGFIIASIWDG